MDQSGFNMFQVDFRSQALRILRRFLEQGSEVLCAAGALDPTATVSVVAMQVGLGILLEGWSRQRIEISRYRDFWIVPEMPSDLGL